ncbi:MAG TPA: HD domain-containing phosphohydrolase [Chloroflexia bacterium]|nr:HD domain-containing phosphohydrolase [Chloroflexia bacterium]
MLITKPTSKALVVDDIPSITQVISNALGLHNFTVRSVHDPLEALQICKRESFELVLMDVRMPNMDGIELLHHLKVLNPSATYVMMTAEDHENLKTVIRALKEGAQGFVIKPFRISELILSVNLALEKTSLMRENIRMKVYAPLLEGATSALLSALEVKDASTQNHSNRVSYYAQRIAQAYRHEMKYDEMLQVRLGSLFHDVGKIGVPDYILKKPGPLTPDERREIMKHPEIGARIIGAVEGMEKVSAIVRAHHERFDGKGYPDGLKGTDIPLGARITSVADCFEAMVSPRVYSPGRSVEYALTELRRCRATQFDPDVVDEFLRQFEAGEIVHQPASPGEINASPVNKNICANPVLPQSA